VLEKAIAGTDQSWSPREVADWAECWDAICADDIKRKVENPHNGPPPTGYVRLNQGCNAWDRAELLTQLTGDKAAVLSCPEKPIDLTKAFARQLDDNKPLLVGARQKNHDREALPHNLVPAHAYEVVAIRDDKIVLHNPWNRDHPEPMSPEEFSANMRPFYTTLI